MITLLRTGARIEAKSFLDSLLTGDLAAELRVLRADDGGPFVYPVINAPGGTREFQDREFGYLAAIPEPVQAALRGGRGLLVIDHSGEGGEAKPKQLAALHGRLAALGIAPGRVMFLTQNVRFAEGYEAWRGAQGEGRPAPIAVDLYHAFLRQLVSHVTRKVIPFGEFARRRTAHIRAVESGAMRPKSFLCLNYTPRYHRLAMMLTIMHHGLEGLGHVSFPGLANRKLSIAGREEALLRKAPFPDMPALEALLPVLAAQRPRVLDTDPFSSASPVVELGAWWLYAESWFSLVTESGIVGRGHERFTEKPFKPVLGLHPFLVVGLPRTLALMRDYGFRSFSPHFDESYDEMTDDAARMAAVIAEFRRLCAIPAGAWPALGRSLLEVVLHNYDQFGGPIQRHLTEVVERPLLARMAALAAPAPA